MTPSNLARAGVIAQQPSQPRPSPAGRAPEARPARRDQAAEDKLVSLRRTIVLFVILAPLVAVNVIGASYYFAPLGERVRSPLHPWLRPSGYIGQSAGILTLAIFIFLWLYPLRKKWKALAFTGSVGKWLDVHVTTALALPTLLAIHAAWRSEGLIGLGLISMLVVIASGIVGRYIYTRIPRTKSGV
jgi:dihydropyrimidine dehydrogenase (NAD+) subunit PreT